MAGCVFNCICKGENLNQMYIQSIKNARISLTKAQVYCDVIKELFAFIEDQSDSGSELVQTLEEDIQLFIEKQDSKLEWILESNEVA